MTPKNITHLKALSSLVIALTIGLSATAAEKFIHFSRANQHDIELTNSNDTVKYDPSDWEEVIIAVNNLRNDLKAVTGSDKASIVVGTAGKSKAVDKYTDIANRLKGKWEQYIMNL